MTQIEQVIQGLQIINTGEDPTIEVDHEILYAGSDGLTKEQDKELKKLGWHLDKAIDSWYINI